eukprot:263928_1
MTMIASCGPMETFEIDGNYYVDNSSRIDWITVIDGCRMGPADPWCVNWDCGNVDGMWIECQSQCLQTGGLYSQYWSSGVFCDTYGNTEQSLIKSSNFFDTWNWVPLAVNSAGPAKGDLTNIFYAGSSVDMIMCLAMERINPQGASYIDFEFIQTPVEYKPCKDKDGNLINGTTRDWKCHTSNRTIDDMQISFILGTETSGFKILFCRWRPDFKNAPDDNSFNKTSYFIANNLGPPPDWLLETENPHCGENGLAESEYWAFGWIEFDGATLPGTWTASTPEFQQAVDGAVNLGNDHSEGQRIYDAASPFGHIDSQKATDPANVWMEAGTFMEACIDWQAIGFNSMCYAGLMVKTKASSNGSPKDTGGFIVLDICGNVNMTFQPTQPSRAPSGKPSVIPSETPTQSSINPSSAPTSTTNTPTQTTNSPIKNPTQTPTKIPTQTTEIPTQTTNIPTKTPTETPTKIPSNSPIIQPTKSPSFNPTKFPTISPSFNPTISPSNPTNNPTTSNPTITRNPTINPT